MQAHGPKRVYTPQSLEFWFGRLENDWSNAFSESQLAHGRQLYREGEVRELELTETDAIIHRRIEKRDEYAVIEWEDTKALSVRSSTTDVEIARALAVAGLHEIEELVADEIPPMAFDYESNGSGSNGHNGGSSHNGHNGGATSSKTDSNGGAAKTAVASQRRLLLVFKTKRAGLTFQACWVDRKKERHPALGDVAHADGNGHVSSGERAKLIGLAAYARKAHFNYNQKTGIYVMESLVEIPNFLKVTLQAWRRMFSIELDDKSAHLVKGTRTIEIEAVAEKLTGNSEYDRSDSETTGLNLRWIFRSGEKMLTATEVKSLLRHQGKPVILPNYGIVTLSEERWASYKTWQKNIKDTHGDAALSPYLVFSLFNGAEFKLTLTPEIEVWRKRF